MKQYRILFFLFFVPFFLLSQDNDEILNAVEITCDTSIESTTIGYLSDQSQLTEWGLLGKVKREKLIDKFLISQEYPSIQQKKDISASIC